jgi:hypothetical protein
VDACITLFAMALHMGLRLRAWRKKKVGSQGVLRQVAGHTLHMNTVMCVHAVTV